MVHNSFDWHDEVKQSLLKTRSVNLRDNHEAITYLELGYCISGDTVCGDEHRQLFARACISKGVCQDESTYYKARVSALFGSCHKIVYYLVNMRRSTAAAELSVTRVVIV